MKIFLAGGAGYIGTVLANCLIEYGYDIEVVDLCWFGNHFSDNVVVTKKNLFECNSEDFKGFDQVIFLAGLSNDPMAEFNPSQNFIYNAALPSYLAFESKKADIRRFIYASSCSVYGYTINQFYDEESPVTCDYPYGIAKLQGERGVLQLLDKNFSVISLRQGTVCGHSPRMRMDLIVNTMFKTAMVDGKIIVNNPSIWRPIYDIRDSITGFLRAIQADYSISGIFNVASDNYTVGHVGDLVKREIERLTSKKIKLEIHNKKDYRNYKVSIEKAKTELGFNPQYSIEDIVIDLHEHKHLYGDYNKDIYYNINTFHNLKPLK